MTGDLWDFSAALLGSWLQGDHGKEQQKSKERDKDEGAETLKPGQKTNTDRSRGRESWSLDTQHPHKCWLGLMACL